MTHIKVLQRLVIETGSPLGGEPIRKFDGGLTLSVRPVTDGRAVLAQNSAHRLSSWPVACEPSPLSALRHYNRRVQWLTGRLCLQDLVLDRCGPSALNASMVRSSAGGPEVVDHSGHPVIPVSISHDTALAAAVMAPSACAVDIEERSALGTACVDTLFSHHEWTAIRSCLGHLPEPDQPTVYWTLLECLSKLFHCPSLGKGRFRLVGGEGPADQASASPLYFASTASVGTGLHAISLLTLLYSRHVLTIASSQTSGARPAEVLAHPAVNAHNPLSERIREKLR
ncbi:MAG: hypothetical protein LBJ08_08210 [Bifidobacteriaceae bacterium]|jgi:hypothetical protein|nr:hypothetical protein [Bifidobacteriaceae bacterium]